MIMPGFSYFFLFGFKKKLFTIKVYKLLYVVFVGPTNKSTKDKIVSSELQNKSNMKYSFIPQIHTFMSDP